MQNAPYATPRGRDGVHDCNGIMGVASHSATNASGTDTVNQQTEEKNKRKRTQKHTSNTKNVNHKSTYQVHLDYIKHHVEIIVSSMTN